MGYSAEVAAGDHARLEPARRTDLRRWLVAGIVVAVLDMSFAQTYWVVIRNKTTFARVVQSIASGLLGKSAFQGGSRTVLLGALLHLTVAFGWSGIFLLAIRRWKWLGRVLASPHGALKTGMPFGLLVWTMMDFVVIPLSRTTATPMSSSWFWLSLAWHAVGVGLPIALVYRGRLA